MIQINDIAAIAAEQNDLNKAKEFKEREPLVAGNVLLRLREYYELGLHPGSEKHPKPAMKGKAVFECVTKKHLEENAEGKQVPRTIEVYFNCGSTAKAGDRKLFSSMNVASGGVYKHFAEMIGKPFKATITNNVVKGENGKADRTYSNLDAGPRGATAYTFVPAMLADDEGELTVPIQVPAMYGVGKLFLWEMEGLSDDQIKEMWEDIYIDGEWEAKEAEDGKPARPARSKNVLQQKLMDNLAWEGSRTQGLVEDFVEIDDLTGDAVEPEEEESKEGLENLAGLAAKEEVQEAETVADVPEIPGLDD